MTLGAARARKNRWSATRSETGEPRWQHSVVARHATTLGGIGPRSTPTIVDGRVYALGATGVLRCLDGASGDQIWRVNMLQMMGSSPEEDIEGVPWGRATSPLVLEQLVVVPFRGSKGWTVLFVGCLQPRTRANWSGGAATGRWPSVPRDWLACSTQTRFSSSTRIPRRATIQKRAHVLWEVDWPGKTDSSPNCSQAAPLSGDRVLLSKGYGGGAKLLQLAKEGNGIKATATWEDASLLETKLTNVAILGDYAFGLSDGVLECVSLEAGAASVETWSVRSWPDLVGRRIAAGVDRRR